MKTYKRKLFAIIVYGYKLLTISVTKFLLDVCKSPRSVSPIELNKILYKTEFSRLALLKMFLKSLSVIVDLFNLTTILQF